MQADPARPHLNGSPSPRPTIVLLPGMLCSDRLWHAQTEQLTRHANIEFVQLTAGSIRQMAGQVLALPQRRLVLIGLSLGAIVAMAVAETAPARVHALGLISANARPPRPEQRRAWAEMATRTRTGDFSSITSRTLMPQLIHPDRADDPRITDTVQAMADEVGPAVFLRQLAAQQSRFDLRPGLRRLRCPTLLIAGAGDPLTPPSTHREIADIAPDARLHVLPDTGHLSPLEAPTAITQLLGDWVTRIG